MKYTIAILVSTFLFGLVGLFSALGAGENYIVLPFGGVVVGLVVGCIAAFLGHRFSQRESDGKSNAS